MDILNKINELPEDIKLEITRFKQKENILLKMCFKRWKIRANFIKLYKFSSNIVITFYVNTCKLLIDELYNREMSMYNYKL